MQRAPAGEMLSVALGAEEASEFLENQCALAAINAEKQCVISGRAESIARIALRLTERQIAHTALTTSHAFHSPSMDSILAEFATIVAQVKLAPTTIPYVSNLTGEIFSKGSVIDGSYWVEHLRNTVRFADGIHTLIKGVEKVFLEVGPGRTLSSLVRKVRAPGAQSVISSSRHAAEKVSDEVAFLEALGQLWQAGVPVEWHAVQARNICHRVELPTYPFERVPVGDQRGAITELRKPDSTPHAPTHTESVEETLQGIWRDLLGVESIRRADNFFDLGGDSLLAVQLGARIEARMGRPLPMRQFLAQPTLASLAELVGTAQTG
jgi:acyl transferase domain-containing protein